MTIWPPFRKVFMDIQLFLIHILDEKKKQKNPVLEIYEQDIQLSHITPPADSITQITIEKNQCSRWTPVTKPFKPSSNREEQD